MRITIAAVGKIKEAYFADAIAEYSKRLSRYCKMEILEVSDEKTPEHAGTAQEEQIRKTEGDRLRKIISDDAYIIALAIDGKQMSSVDFALHMDRLAISGHSHLVFLIGGSIGLDSELLQEADEQISFSAMTFPHQLMRVILLEQIYRGYRIINHEPYHK